MRRLALLTPTTQRRRTPTRCDGCPGHRFVAEIVPCCPLRDEREGAAGVVIAEPGQPLLTSSVCCTAKTVQCAQ